MTVVNPKSISGITSITTASGSDNLLTIHTSDASNTERFRIDSTGTTKIVTGIVTTLTATTGIVTTLTTNTLTANSTTKVGSGVTLSPDGNIFTTGVTTATTFVGALTGTASGNTTISNNSDNRVITGGSGNALNGEANLTYDGDNLSQSIDAAAEGIRITGSGAHYGEISIDSNRTGANQHVGTIKGSWNGTQIARIAFNTGADTTNKDDGRILFATSESGGTLSTRLRITETGDIKIGDQTTASGTLRYLDVQNSDSSSASSGAIIRLISSNQAQNSTTSVDLAKYRDGAFYINNNETHSGATTVFNIGGSEIARFTTGGLAIGGTGTANTLDDYEEGTWTPVWAAGGGSSGLANISNCEYVKIGELVHLRGEFSLTGGSGNVSTVDGWYITGLPFPNTDASGSAGTWWMSSSWTAGTRATGLVMSYGTNILYFGTEYASGMGRLTNIRHFACTYRTN